MLQALIDGQRDPALLADLAKRRLRVKIPELTEALTGRFSEHHAFLARMYLEVIGQRTHQIEELNTRIEVVMEPFQPFCALIRTISGIGQRCAEVIVAETGADMDVFPYPQPVSARMPSRIQVQETGGSCTLKGACCASA
jgi:transposase